MELWDIYDKEKIKTGETIERGKLPHGKHHLVVHVCVFNSKNEMLIQQRQPFKEGWSGMWDLTAGGSAVAGDNSQTAAERELFEEIGYKADLSNIRPHLTANCENSIVDYYLIEKDIDIEKLHLQYEEVKQVKENDYKKILADTRNDSYQSQHLMQKYGFHKTEKYNENPYAELYFELEL